MLCSVVSLVFNQELMSTPMPCRSGLEGLLLGLALQAEQPQLESQRTALLQQEEEQRLQLAALDTQVLQSLATSKASGHTLMPHQSACSLVYIKQPVSRYSTTGCLVDGLFV